MLERPRLYTATSRALAPGTRRRLLALIDAERGPGSAGRTLDVGCGPRSWLARAGFDAIGVDASLSYAAAHRRAGGRAVVARAEALPFRSDSFSSVWSFGLLHHLSDESARVTLIEAARVAGGGRVMIFDGVVPENPIGGRSPGSSAVSTAGASCARRRHCVS